MSDPRAAVLDRAALGEQPFVDTIMSIGANQELRSLSAENCSMGPKLTSLLAESLIKNKSNVSSINLNGNDLYSSGLEEIFPLLDWSPSCPLGLGIESIELRNNDIDDDGAILLASHLECCDVVGLLRLDLGWNRIGEAGAAALLAIVTRYPTLRINLLGNLVGESTLQKFKSFRDPLRLELGESDSGDDLRIEENENNSGVYVISNHNNNNNDNNNSNIAEDGNQSFLNLSTLADLSSANPPKSESKEFASMEEARVTNYALKFKVDLLNKEILELKQQLRTAANEKIAYDARLESSFSRTAELEQQLSQSQFFAEQLQEAIYEQNRKNSSLVDEKMTILKTAELETEKLKETYIADLDDKRREIEELKHVVACSETTITTLTHENLVLSTRLADLEAQRDSEREIMEAKAIDDNKYRCEIDMKVLSLSSENDSLQSRLTSTLAQIEYLENRNVETMETYLRDFRNEKQRYESEVATLRGEYESQISSLQGILKEARDEASSISSNMHKQAHSHEILIAEMQKVFNEELKKIKATERQSQELVVADLKKKCELLTNAVQNSEAKCNEIMARAELSSSDSKRLVHKVKAQLSSLESDLKATRNKFDGALDKNEELEAEVFKKTKLLEKSERMNGELEKQNLALQSEVKALNGKYNELANNFELFQQRVKIENIHKNMQIESIRKKIMTSVSSQLNSLE